MWHVGEEGPKLTLFFNFRPVKAQTAALYDRSPYTLSDKNLASLAEFFEIHWDTLGGLSTNVNIALRRFNSSYERYELVDRLIDLVIALEALFGDKEQGSITYKLAMRGASWLHPLGQGRTDAFRTIKRLYGLRSRAVHGGALKPIQGCQVDELEDIVRRSLLKFLNRLMDKGCAPKGSQIDELIMSGRI